MAHHQYTEMRISLIAAVAENGVIGRDNALPWRLPQDLAFFKRTTVGHHCIMGRKTFESFPKLLPDRVSLIITSNPKYKTNSTEALIAPSLDQALALAHKANETEAFIIGGNSVFSEAMPYADYMYITEVHARPEGDTYFPPINRSEWKETSRQRHLPDEKHSYAYSFVKYERKV